MLTFLFRIELINFFFKGKQCKEKVTNIVCQLEEDAKREEEAKEARKRPVAPPPKVPDEVEKEPLKNLPKNNHNDLPDHKSKYRMRILI